jgi:hypothetical protein
MLIEGEDTVHIVSSILLHLLGNIDKIIILNLKSLIKLVSTRRLTVLSITRESVFPAIVLVMVKMGRNGIQHNDTQHNDIQHNDSQHNGTLYRVFL